MSDESASGSEEETTVGTAMTTGDSPRDVTPTVTRPTGKLYPLNSSRLATDVIKKIAVQLGVPGTASRADTQPMVD